MPARWRCATGSTSTIWSRLSVRVLMADPRIAELYRGRLRWISVDEFQDVDEQQYRLLTLLAPPDGNLCAIGDPNQAIYGFRGADASCFDRFRQDYPAARIVRLARNYRSTGTIVTRVLAGHCAATERAGRRDRARHARAHRHPCRADGTRRGRVGGEDDRAHDRRAQLLLDRQRPRDVGPQAEPVVRRLRRALPHRRASRRSLREALDRSGIPYQKHSHTALAEEPAVRALLQELGDGSDASDAGG